MKEIALPATDFAENAVMNVSRVDWQPFFGQIYSEQEITFTTVLILLT